jgi:hypothetical protein
VRNSTQAMFEGGRAAMWNQGNLTGPPYSSQTSRPVNRPANKLPAGYKPSSSLPPGYLPPLRDLEKTGAMVNDMKRSKLSRRQIFMLAGGAVALVLFILVIGFVVGSSLVVQSAIGNPDTTVQHFYADLNAQNYTGAYKLLSPQFQQRESQQSFASQYQQLEGLGGPIGQITILSDVTSGSHAKAVVQFTRDPTQPRLTQDTLQLIQSNGSWLIDSITTQSIISTATPAA